MYSTQPALTPGALVWMLRRYWARWTLPAIVIAAAVGAYAAVRKPTWEASQAVTVRNEAVASWNSPGKFRHDNEMKTLEETLLEVAMSRGVLLAALADVGPPEDWTGTWPALAAIDELRLDTTVAAPKGSEFGKTEVFYLKVKDKSRTRSVELAKSIFSHLERRVEEVRNVRIGGVVEELTKAATLAHSDLDASNARLVAMEERVGGDLVELRLLHQSATGSSELQRTFVDTQNELRQAKQALNQTAELLAIIKAAQQNPHVLLAAPNALLDLQPNVRRLKDGLNEAQLRTATALGLMTEKHPQIVALRTAEEEIHRSIIQELPLAVRGVEADSKLAQSRIELLERQLDGMRAQRDRLAQLRAEYMNLSSDVEHRRKLVEEADRQLADATANQLAAQSCSLIAAIDEPDTGSKPVGPGTLLIAAAGACAGLLVGLGLLFLTAPLPLVNVAEGALPALPWREASLELTEKSSQRRRKRWLAKNGELPVAKEARGARIE